MHECSGWIGKILGHNFKEIYDEDIEKRSANEIATIVHNAHEFNTYALMSNQISPDLDQVKRKTKVFKGLFCTRCGETLDDPLKM